MTLRKEIGTMLSKPEKKDTFHVRRALCGSCYGHIDDFNRGFNQALDLCEAYYAQERVQEEKKMLDSFARQKKILWDKIDNLIKELEE